MTRSMTFKYKYPEDINHKSTQLSRTKRILKANLPNLCQIRENQENYMHDVMSQGRLSKAKKHMPSSMSKLEEQPKMSKSYFKPKMVWSFKTAVHTLSYSTYILTLYCQKH